MIIVSCKNDILSPDIELATPITSSVDLINFKAAFVLFNNRNSIGIFNTEKNEFVNFIYIENAKFLSSISLSKKYKNVVLTIPNSQVENINNFNTKLIDEKIQTFNNGYLIKISTEDGRTLSTTKINGINFDAEYLPNEKEIWTTSFENINDNLIKGKVYFIDQVNLQNLGFIEVENKPIDIAFSKDGLYGFVLNYGSQSVSIVSVKTKKIVNTIKVGKNPKKLITTLDGKLFVINEGDNSINVFNTSDFKIQTTYHIDVKPTSVNCSPRGDIWVSSSESNKVYFYSKLSDIKTGEIESGKGANDITFSNDGKFCFVTNSLEGTISKINIDQKSIVKSNYINSYPTKFVDINSFSNWDFSIFFD